MKIRCFRKKDLRWAVDELRDAFIAVNDQEHPMIHEDIVFPKRRKALRRYIEDWVFRKDVVPFFARRDGKLAGILFLRFQDGAYASPFYIFPEYRGRGVGTKLMNFAIRHLKKKHSEENVLKVVVAAGATDSAGFYDYHGFEPIYQAYGLKLAWH